MNRKLSMSLFVVCLLLALLLTGNKTLDAATGKITGIVKESQTEAPLPGANVILEGTTMGAATDLEGRFIIPGFHLVPML